MAVDLTSIWEVVTSTSVVLLSRYRPVLVECASVLLVGLLSKGVVYWLWAVGLPGLAVVVSRCSMVTAVGDFPVEGLWVWV